jgi:hypothetical protein
MRRPRLTYAHVAATVALFIAVGGGTVYAAVQLGKNDVRSRNIAPKAVKSSDIARNAVTSRKIKNGAVRASDIAVGVLNRIVDVKGSARGGPITPVNGAADVPVPLSGNATFTPGPGQVGAVAAEAQFTVASAAAQLCNPGVILSVDGEEAAYAYVDTNSPTPVTERESDAEGPFGLIDPNAPVTVTAEIDGDTDCTADSRLDRLEIRFVSIR